MSRNADEETSIKRAYKDIEKFNSFEAQEFEDINEIKIAFIGNSITMHGPAPEIGWLNSCGMAASSIANDYAHKTLELLSINVKEAAILNAAEFERDLINGKELLIKLKSILNKNPKYVVVQLGDNISSNEQLVSFINNANLVFPIIRDSCSSCIVLSTWWESEAKDYVMRELSRKFGFKYLFIGDIYSDSMNEDRKERHFIHDGVDTHPKDWGMLKVAERVYAAIAQKESVNSYSK